MISLAIFGKTPPLSSFSALCPFYVSQDYLLWLSIGNIIQILIAGFFAHAPYFIHFTNNLSLKSVVANEWGFALGLKTNWDLHVFVHDPGDEIWLTYMNFVFDMIYFKLDAHNSDGVRSTDVSLKVNENHFRSSQRAPCKSYSKVRRQRSSCYFASTFIHILMYLLALKSCHELNYFVKDIAVCSICSTVVDTTHPIT